MGRLGKLCAGVVILAASWAAPAQGGPAAAEKPVVWAVHQSLAPAWFDPADTPGSAGPFIVLYALHDALLKPMPGNAMAPSLAESWSVSPDGLRYEFALRKELRFHDGEPLTADDVVFSFQRYRGAAASTLHEHVASVEVVDALHVRFRLKAPWPDFLVFYGTTATGAGWIVPRKYLEKVGEDGFKKAPIGAGPYRFVSFTPGVELVLEANEGYWRKKPAVKRIVLRSVPDETTRFAMLRNGEADIAYQIRGALAEELQRAPGLRLKASSPTSTEWLVFADQWDPKSPWADRRVRLAANLAIDREAINQADYLGFAKPGASIIPHDFPFYWAAPAYAYDPERARQLLAEAGYPGGFDAGQIASDNVYVPEAVAGYLGAVGIRVKLRPMERAAFNQADREKKLHNLVRAGSGAGGNAATRIEAFVLRSGDHAYGGYADLDELYAQQAAELDPAKRAAILQHIQELMHERVMFAPIVEPAFLSGCSARVAEPGLGLIAGHPYSAPYEDVVLEPAAPRPE